MMSNEKIRVALLSLLASVSITVMNVVAWLLTNSLAVLAEAIHTALDILVTAITLAAVSVGSKPPDKEHPYGHGKAESIGGLFGSLFIIIAGILIGYESAERLILGIPFSPDPVAAVVMAIAIVVDLNRSRALRRAAIKWNSRALEADSYHFMSDVAISASVIALIIAGKLMELFNVGLFDVWGTVLDSLLSFGIVIYFSIISARLIRTSIDELMDRMSEDLARRAATAALTVPGVLRVRDVKARRAGSMAHIEITIGVSDHLGIADAHRIADEVEAAIKREVGRSIVMVHVEPELREKIEKALASIRDPLLVNIHELTITKLSRDTVVSMHVVVRSNARLSDVERILREIESSIKNVEPNVKVWIHVEPEKAIINSDEIRNLASAVAAKYGGYVGDVEIINVGGINLLRVLIYLPPEIDVLMAHNIATEIEGEISRVYSMPRHVIVTTLPMRDKSRP
ncbi:MAG: cation diffusion facilitator family transporter [Vulcanisaeta sp.]